MRWLLSPLSLLLICWALSGAGVALTLAYLDRLDLVQTFMRREDLSLSAFTTTGAAWLFLALLAYAVGDLAARFSYRSPQGNNVQINLTRAAYLTFALNLVLLGVTALWIATAAAQAGGLMHLAAAAYIDSLTTRDLLLENKLFTGMRLFYAALPGTACLATALLCLGPLPHPWPALIHPDRQHAGAFHPAHRHEPAVAAPATASVMLPRRLPDPGAARRMGLEPVGHGTIPWPLDGARSDYQPDV